MPSLVFGALSFVNAQYKNVFIISSSIIVITIIIIICWVG